MIRSQLSCTDQSINEGYLFNACHWLTSVPIRAYTDDPLRHCSTPLFATTPFKFIGKNYSNGGQCPDTYSSPLLLRMPHGENYDSDCDYDAIPEAGRIKQHLDSDESYVV